MIVTVARTAKTSDGIFGNLIIDGDPFKCVTEENMALCIPAGVYDLVWMWSEHFQQIMPHVLVPGRVAIEIHWANYPKELEGCVALGTNAEIASDCIDESKVAWISFIKAILNQPGLKIKITEDYA